MTPPITPIPTSAVDLSAEARAARCAPVCPLCGGPNACAVSASGCLDTACWCAQVRIPVAVLAAVPVPARGRACVCRSCAQAPGASATTQQT